MMHRSALLPTGLIAAATVAATTVALPAGAAEAAPQPVAPVLAASGQASPAPKLPAKPAPADKLGTAELEDGPGARYIVRVAKKSSVRGALAGTDYANLSGPAFKGAVARLTKAQATELAEQPGVVSVSRDGVVKAFGKEGEPLSPADAVPADQPAASAYTPAWGLDRIDQRNLPLNNDYSPPTTGAGVHVFVIDSGLITSNPEFAGRVGKGAYIADLGSVQDCNGHGTHVAGTVGSTKYGAAKSSIIHPVRVLDCDGRGLNSDIILGMNWVIENAPARSVVNMSLGGDANTQMNAAARNLVDSGLAVAVAAGNDAEPACWFSPASEPSVLTVGAANRYDQDTDFSNFGPCVDLYAPGRDILSTDYMGGSGRVMSGTSMASPHVAGAMAVYWSYNPGASNTQVQAAIMAIATRNVLEFPYGQAGSPNIYLFDKWPANLPSAPRALRVVPGNTTATLSWLPPTSPGVPAVSAYRIEWRGTATSWRHVGNVPASTRSVRLTGMTNGAQYAFRVAAVSGSGVGPYATSGYVVPKGVPGRPGRPAVRVAKGKRATVAWKAAPHNGAAVTYQLQVSQNRRNWRVAKTTTRLRWSGRVPGAVKRRKTSFRVVPRNALGVGQASPITTRRMK